MHWHISWGSVPKVHIWIMTTESPGIYSEMWHFDIWFWIDFKRHNFLFKTLFCEFFVCSPSHGAWVQPQWQRKTSQECETALTSQHWILFLVFVFSSNYLLIFLSVYLFVFLSFCLFVFLSFCLFCLFSFCLFFLTSLRSNVWRVSSFKSHYLCQNSKVAVTHWLTKVRYRAARAAKNKQKITKK